MKAIWHLIILGIIGFIMLVSYKILEPNVIDTYSRSETAEEDRLNQRNENKGDDSVTPGKKLSGKTLRDAVIAEITSKYLLNYFHPLTESPWKVAESIATNRQLHPTHCNELGFPEFFGMHLDADLTSICVRHHGPGAIFQNCSTSRHPDRQFHPMREIQVPSHFARTLMFISETTPTDRKSDRDGKPLTNQPLYRKYHSRSKSSNVAL